MFHSIYTVQISLVSSISARNGSLEVPVYFLKARWGYAIIKMKKCK
jgi:hypothetical protein